MYLLPTQRTMKKSVQIDDCEYSLGTEPSEEPRVEEGRL